MRLGNVRQRRGLARVTIIAVLLGTSALIVGVNAASNFANPAFQTQWAAGEALVPNFWGPLNLARDGQQEPYVEAPGGQRLVQYFDKARMELTNPSTGVVTNGLLAVELVNGRVQLGDNTFEQRTPAAVPMAGDPNNVGPTYAMLKALEAQILVAVSPTQGAATTRALTPTGTATTFDQGTTFPQANISAYDQTTGHNVPTAFAAFRDKAGLASIGLAISEPFWSNVKVAGQPKDVLMQAFERRVLTYTPSNPAAFQVEFGNIGIQYYTWRYSGGSTPAATTVPTATIPATTTPAATTTGSSGRGPCVVPISAVFVDQVPAVKRNTATTVNVKVLDEGGNTCGDGTQVVIADTGVTTTITGGTKVPNGSSYVVATVTNGVATMTFTTAAPNASAPGPIDIAVYRVRPQSELQTGGFGAPISPEYKPAII